MPMREGMVICPRGRKYHAVMMQARDQLIDAFGGCTITASVGSWRGATGQVITEPVWQLVVAYNPFYKVSRLPMERVAQFIGREAKQQAVYVRYANGHVEIIPTGQLWQQAAE